MFDFDWNVYAALVLVLFLMALPILHRKFYGAVPEIDAGELLQPGKKFRLVDLRSAIEYQTSHIDNSINLPYSGNNQCQQKLQELISNNDLIIPTVLICDTDLLSTKLCKKLMNTGNDNVFVLKGGFNYWKRKRLPLKIV